eukprot:317618_1
MPRARGVMRSKHPAKSLSRPSDDHMPDSKPLPIPHKVLSSVDDMTVRPRMGAKTIYSEVVNLVFSWEYVKWHIYCLPLLVPLTSWAIYNKAKFRDDYREMILFGYFIQLFEKKNWTYEAQQEIRLGSYRNTGNSET